MDLLRCLRTFVRVADEGSFAGAARSLDVDPAAVTRQMAELEDHLGARLMQRTTRRMTLTPIGEDFLAQARELVLAADDAVASVSQAAREARGHVRVLLPPALSTHQVAPRMAQFLARHPGVSVELVAPGSVDTVDDAFDLTLLHVRHALAGGFVARRLARVEVVLCAAPSYLDRAGRPAHPLDLRAHDTLLPPVASLQRGVTFERRDGGGTEHIVPKTPVLACVHTDTNRTAALAGLGVVGLPSFAIAGALREGRLERVLPDWRLFSLTLWAATPSRKHLPARTRVLLDFLVEAFGGEDADPWLDAG